jgi:hypothetical protein
LPLCLLRPTDPIADIFSNIELIVDLHEELLRLLQERILEWPSKTHFGDIFLKMIPIMVRFAFLAGYFPHFAAETLQHVHPQLWFGPRLAGRAPDLFGSV